MSNNGDINSVCVYCASSTQADPSYRESARKLGYELGAAGIAVVYGGGRDGSMGAVADGALEAGGKVIGILPQFMPRHRTGPPRHHRTPHGRRHART